MEMVSRMTAAEALSERLKDEFSELLYRVENKMHQQCKELEGFLTQRMEDIDRRRVHSVQTSEDRLSSSERSVKDLRDMVQELRNALASLERGMSGLEEHRVTLERTFRSTTDSLQQKMTERVKSDIEGLQEVMHRSSESLMKFRQEQIESISTVVEKISEFKGSMGSSLYDMKSQVDSCEKIVIRLGEKFLEEQKRAMDLSSRLNAVESKHTHLEKANREFSTFRDQTHSWRVEVEREIKNGESGLREIRDLLSEVDSKDRELKRSMQDSVDNVERAVHLKAERLVSEVEEKLRKTIRDSVDSMRRDVSSDIERQGSSRQAEAERLIRESSNAWKAADLHLEQTLRSRIAEANDSLRTDLLKKQETLEAELNHARTTFQAMVVSQEEAEGGAAKVDASLIHTVESRLKSNMETLIHQSKKDCEESMAKRQAHWKGELEELSNRIRQEVEAEIISRTSQSVNKAVKLSQEEVDELREELTREIASLSDRATDIQEQCESAVQKASFSLEERQEKKHQQHQAAVQNLEEVIRNVEGRMASELLSLRSTLSTSSTSDEVARALQQQASAEQERHRRLQAAQEEQLQALSDRLDLIASQCEERNERNELETLREEVKDLSNRLAEHEVSAQSESVSPWQEEVHDLRQLVLEQRAQLENLQTQVNSMSAANLHTSPSQAKEQESGSDAAAVSIQDMHSIKMHLRELESQILEGSRKQSQFLTMDSLEGWWDRERDDLENMLDSRLGVMEKDINTFRGKMLSDYEKLSAVVGDLKQSSGAIMNSPILEERVEVLRTTIAALEGQVTSLFTAFEELHTSCADAQDVQSLWANVRQGLEVAEELQVEVAALRQHITRQSLYSVPPEKGVDADSEEDAEDQEINSALFRNYSGLQSRQVVPSVDSPLSAQGEVHEGVVSRPGKIQSTLSTEHLAVDLPCEFDGEGDRMSLPAQVDEDWRDVSHVSEEIQHGDSDADPSIEPDRSPSASSVDLDHSPSPEVPTLQPVMASEVSSPLPTSSSGGAAVLESPADTSFDLSLDEDTPMHQQPSPIVARSEASFSVSPTSTRKPDHLPGPESQVDVHSGEKRPESVCYHPGDTAQVPPGEEDTHSVAKRLFLEEEPEEEEGLDGSTIEEDSLTEEGTESDGSLQERGSLGEHDHPFSPSAAYTQDAEEKQPAFLQRHHEPVRLPALKSAPVSAAFSALPVPHQRNLSMDSHASVSSTGSRHVRTPSGMIVELDMMADQQSNAPPAEAHSGGVEGASVEQDPVPAIVLAPASARGQELEESPCESDCEEKFSEEECSSYHSRTRSDSVLGEDGDEDATFSGSNSDVGEADDVDSKEGVPSTSDSPAPERELGGGEGDAPGPGATVQFSESDEDDEGADLSDCVDEDALAVLEGKQSVEEYRNMVEAQRREQEEQNAAAAAAEAQRKREEEERQSRPQGRHVNVGLRRLPVPSLSPVSTSQSESRSRSEAPAPRVHGVLRPLDSSVHGRSLSPNRPLVGSGALHAGSSDPLGSIQSPEGSPARKPNRLTPLPPMSSPATTVPSTVTSGGLHSLLALDPDDHHHESSPTVDKGHSPSPLGSPASHEGAVATASTGGNAALVLRRLHRHSARRASADSDDEFDAAFQHTTDTSKDEEPLRTEDFIGHALDSTMGSSPALSQGDLRRDRDVMEWNHHGQQGMPSSTLRESSPQLSEGNSSRSTSTSPPPQRSPRPGSQYLQLRPLVPPRALPTMGELASSLPRSPGDDTLGILKGVSAVPMQQRASDHSDGDEEELEEERFFDSSDEEFDSEDSLPIL